MKQPEFGVCSILKVTDFQFFSTSVNFLFLQEENLRIESIWGCVQDVGVTCSKTWRMDARHRQRKNTKWQDWIDHYPSESCLAWCLCCLSCLYNFLLSWTNENGYNNFACFSCSFWAYTPLLYFSKLFFQLSSNGGAFWLSFYHSAALFHPFFKIILSFVPQFSIRYFLELAE